jgi:hypothetical protein
VRIDDTPARSAISNQLLIGGDAERQLVGIVQSFANALPNATAAFIVCQVCSFIQNCSQREASGQPVKVDVVLGHYFEDLGAVPLWGRLLGPADQIAAAEPAAVVSERLWRTAMGSDPRAVGSMIAVAGRSVTVVGVMTPAFKGLFANVVAADIWVSTRVLGGRTHARATGPCRAKAALAYQRREYSVALTLVPRSMLGAQS